MLKDTDLQAFLSALEASGDPAVFAAPPSSVLLSESGLFPPELWRLVCSLQIAAVAGEAPQLAATAAQVILEDLGKRRFFPLSEASRWAQAIAWARLQPVLANPSALQPPSGREREVVVGNACLRLKKRRYKTRVGAYGSQIDEPSRGQIIQSVESLVGVLGGVETANQVVRFLCDAKMYHDGMFLFGETGLNIYDVKRPMIPVGWLMSVALRYLNRPGSARKPQVAWKSLVELATDFAAVHDCQRYSQFAGTNLHASQIHRTLLDSTLWREFFTLPQMPSEALRQILYALEAVLTKEDQEKLEFNFPRLSREIAQLVSWSADDKISLHPTDILAQRLPTFYKLHGGAKVANANYADPLSAKERTQDATVLFAAGKNRSITLPRAFLAPAACELIFRKIWATLGKRAESVVKDTLERAIAAACQGKATTIFSNTEYHVGRKRYEFDVATRSEDRIVLIETKGKMLTSQSRSGDMFSFFQDYCDSFLRMMSQLVRHEVHVKNGLTPLTSMGEASADLRPIKIAVSPLSYGPVSDKLLSSNLLRSLAGIKLTPISPDAANQKIMTKFHQYADGILTDMALVAPKRDGHPDLFPYLINVFWLDLGQLLYILRRGRTVPDAFGPLTHITFSSRDFWTELAHADRGGLTKDRWTPVG